MIDRSLACSALLIATAIGAPTGSHRAGAAEAGDPVVAVCADGGKDDAVCRCAADELRAAVDEDDYRLYADVSAAYLEAAAGGAGRGDAWNGAVEAAAERGVGSTRTLETTNAIGRTHRDAIKGCAAG